MTKPVRKVEYLTTPQAAQKLRVSEARISQLVKEGALKPAAKEVGGRALLFLVTDVDALKTARLAELIKQADQLRST